MGDQEIIKSEDACAIPKWAPNRGLRYEVDDFIVSPPSNEDGGFFHLRYGQRSKPRASTYDRINQELGMAIECGDGMVKDGEPVISGVGLSGVENTSPTITLTPTGLCPVSSAETTPDTASILRTKPLFVLDWKNFRLGREEEIESPASDTDKESPGIQIISSEFDEFKSREVGSSNLTIENSATLVEEAVRSGHQEPDRPRRKISLIERVQGLQVTPEFNDHSVEIKSPVVEAAELKENQEQERPRRKISFIDRVQGLNLSPDSSDQTVEIKSPVAEAAEQKENQEQDRPRRKISFIERVQQGLHLSPSPDSSDQTFEKSISAGEDQLKRETQEQDRSRRKINQINLVEKVQSLQVSPVADPLTTTPFVTPLSTPLTTPLTTPQSSPVIKRKVFSVVMDQGAAAANHGYFCTKPFQGSQQTSDNSYMSGGGGGGSVGLSATSTQMTQQLDNSSRIAAAMDPGQKLGKKRRPKQSTLREMNFWAPTSM